MLPEVCLKFLLLFFPLLFQILTFHRAYYVILGDYVAIPEAPLEGLPIIQMLDELDNTDYSIYYRNVTEPITLLKIKEVISGKNLNLTQFTPTLAAVITWILGEEPVS